MSNDLGVVSNSGSDIELGSRDRHWLQYQAGALGEERQGLIPVHQTVFGDKVGNCFSACVASILGLQIEEIPNFCGDPPSNENWWSDLLRFLEPRGLIAYCFDVSEGNLEFFKSIGVCYIMSGKSPRGNFNHSVVHKEGKFVHDPHPDGLDVQSQIDMILVCEREQVKFDAETGRLDWLGEFSKA